MPAHLLENQLLHNTSLCEALDEPVECVNKTTMYYYSRQMSTCNKVDMCPGQVPSVLNTYPTEKECHDTCGSVAPCPMASPPLV